MCAVSVRQRRAGPTKRPHSECDARLSQFRDIEGRLVRAAHGDVTAVRRHRAPLAGQDGGTCSLAAKAFLARAVARSSFSHPRETQGGRGWRARIRLHRPVSGDNFLSAPSSPRSSSQPRRVNLTPESFGFNRSSHGNGRWRRRHRLASRARSPSRPWPACRAGFRGSLRSGRHTS